MFLRLVSAASCASCCRLIVTVISRPRVHAYITSLEIGTGSRTLYEEKASLSSTSLFSFFSLCSLIRLFFPPLFFFTRTLFFIPSPPSRSSLSFVFFSPSTPFPTHNSLFNLRPSTKTTVGRTFSVCSMDFA